MRGKDHCCFYNGPYDEPASELLKCVKAEREKAAKETKRTRRRRK